MANQTVTINHSTIFNNTGYGIRNALGTTQLHNTIVASNGGLGTTKDINGTLNAASSYNLIGNGDSSGLTNGVNGNLLGTTGSLINAMLGVLQNNGGNTLTHLPSPGSPAINTGNPAFIAPPTQDQRGTGFDRVFDSRLDIGAVEATETSLNLYLPIIVRAASSDLN
ncbi:MAG: choice-of-anchor Q domain-containing protein [Chloroflexota bacterium]